MEPSPEKNEVIKDLEEKPATAESEAYLKNHNSNSKEDNNEIVICSKC